MLLEFTHLNLPFIAFDIVELLDLLLGHDGAPFFELTLPILLHGGGADNEHSFYHFGREEALEQGGHLYCLAQAHVVAKYTAFSVLV